MFTTPVSGILFYDAVDGLLGEGNSLIHVVLHSGLDEELVQLRNLPPTIRRG
jgi:hypothetical protein